jgi:5-methylcytosine-specific restriction endonuclease McrA
MNVRICSKCGEIGLDQIDFRLPWNNGKYCYRPECSLCEQKYSSKYNKEHPEYFKQYCVDNAEHRSLVLKQWKLNNKEYVIERDKQYRIDNAEYIKTSNKQYQHANRDLYRQICRNRRALKAGIPGSHTIEELQALYNKQRGICWCCEQYIPWNKMTVDHIIPITWPNSTDYISNIQLLCKSCNSRKSNKHDKYYLIKK